MTAPTASPSSFSLRNYLQVVRRQKRLIIVATVLTGLLAALPAATAEDVYVSTARVQVSTLDEEGVFDDGSADAGASNVNNVRDLANEIEILQSRPMRAAVVAELPDDQLDFQTPTIALVGISEILEITVTAGDPAVAADVANTYADVFVVDRRDRSVQDLVTKADELKDQSAIASGELSSIENQLIGVGLAPSERTTLQVRQATLVAQVQEFDRRADELEVEAALRGRGTRVVEPATLNLTPVGGGVTSSLLIGLTLGFLLGLALAVVVDTVQDRVSSRDDLADVRPDLPVLASVPHTDPDDRPFGEHPAVLEAFRYLRTGVRVFGLNADLRSLLVTSAVGSEGKTTTAVNLALAMSQGGDRVVLIDADLRRPSVHEHFDLTNERGLSTVVTGDGDLPSVTHFVEDNLAVVTSGPPVHNPTEVLTSPKFRSVLAALIEQADFTIIDSPPVLPVADALLAGQGVDGAIVVGRVGTVRRRSLRDALGRMTEASIEVVGLVANDAEPSDLYDTYDDYDTYRDEDHDAVGADDADPATAR